MKGLRWFSLASFLLAITLILNLVLPDSIRVWAAADPAPIAGQDAPLNPEFEAYWQQRLLRGPESPFYGYIPPTMDLSHLESIPVTKTKGEPALPGAWDWRTQGKVTPVKDQGNAGTCWIFGTLAMTESRVLIVDNQSYDFSEQNLITGVDPAWVYLNVNRANGGGNAFKSTDTLAKKGTRLESVQPYNPSTLNTEACNESYPPLQRVTDFRLVAYTATMTSEIKDAVYNYGPVTVAFCWEASPSHMYAGNIYDWPGCTTSPNHMVSIVGWNDTVSGPFSGPGAWIVKNSWGTSWGNAGYFYLCYGSANLQEVGSYHGSAGYAAYNPREHIYYWDEAGLVASRGYGATSAWMASVFTAERAGSLTHVDFWTTSNNAQYQLYVYNGSFGASLLSSKSGTCAELGYYSIPLDSSVPLNTGQTFTVMVKMTTPGYNYPIPIEKALLYADGITYYCNPPIQTGVCFMRYLDTESWIDLGAMYSRNVCLRARVQETAVLTTDNATIVDTSSARLNGILTSLGSASSVSVSFLWGTSSGNYSHETPAQTVPAAGSLQTHLLCVRSSVQSIADLSANPKIRLPGTSEYRDWVQTALAAYGKTPVFVAMASSDVALALGLGVIDAAVVTVHPADYLADLAEFITTGEGKLLPWSTQAINAVVSAFPSQTVSTFLPANFYPGQGQNMAGYAPGWAFSANLTGLNPGTAYYFRARAIGNGTRFGDEKSFTTLAWYTLTMSYTGSGSVFPTVGPHPYLAGSVVAITATPAGGWRFVNWTGHVATVDNPNAASTNITMNENYSISANFAQIITYNLAVTITGSGTTSPAIGSHSYETGTLVPLTALATPGWQFSHWSGDATGNTNPLTVNMTAARNITANFARQGVTLIGAVKQDPAAFAGRTVTLSGSYRGWESGAGSPPLGRGDWVLRDVTGAMYVTGNQLGLHYPDDVGRLISIMGTIRLKNGQPYIEVPRSPRF